MKDCLEYLIKVKRSEVYLYAPLFEAYQGMLSLRTPNPTKEEYATLQFLVSPDFKSEFEALIKLHKLEIVR